MAAVDAAPESHGLALRWPTDPSNGEQHGDTLDRLRIDIVNDGDEPWHPGPSDSFHVVGHLQGDYSFAYVGGASPATPLAPGESVRVRVHLDERAWDAAADGVHEVSASLISPAVATAEPLRLTRSRSDPDPLAVVRAALPSGSAEARRGDRFVLDRLLTRRESLAVLDLVLELCTLDRFTATALTQRPTSVAARRLEVDRAAGHWFAYEPATGESLEGGADDATGALDVQLAFPDRLRVWGRRGDDHRPILVQRVGRRSLLVTTEHVRDPASRGTLVLDTGLGALVKSYGPAASAILRDVRESAGITRSTPTDLGTLGYTDPEY